MSTSKSGHRIGRRVFVAGAVTSAFSLATPFRAARADTKFSGKTLRILTWTDVTGQAAVKNIAKAFEEQTGAKVISDLTGATSEMVAKIKATASKPQYDVVILSAVGAFELAKAGLLQTPDLNKLPNLEQVVPSMRTGADGQAIGYLLWCDGLLYNTKMFSAAPESWEELWNSKYKSQVALPTPEATQAMDITALACRIAGSDERNPEPGFQKLEALKPNVLLLSINPPQVADLVRSGALALAAPFSPQMFPEFLADPNYNLSITLNAKEGFFFDLQYMVIPKGHPGDDDAAHAFVNFALDPAVQGRMAEDVFYGPINQKTVLSEAARKIPYILDPEQLSEKAIDYDKKYTSSVRQEWIQRYSEIFS